MIRARAVGVAALLAAPAAARADMPVDKPAAIDVERWTATATGWWAGLDDPRVVGLGHLAFGVTTSVITRPIALTSAAGADLGAPVDRRATVTLAAAYGVTETAELRLALPLVLQSGDRLAGIGQPAELQGVATADLRIGGKLTVVHRPRLAVAIAATISIPSGNEAHYTGEAGWMGDVRGLAAYTRGRFGAAINVGVRLRATEVALSPAQVVGNELAGGIALAFRLPAIEGVSCDWTQLRAIVELHGVLGDDVGARRGPSPVELRAGVRGRLWRGWTIGVIAGRGLNDEVGAPRLRAVVDVSWRDTPRDEAAPPLADDRHEHAITPP